MEREWYQVCFVVNGKSIPVTVKGGSWLLSLLETGVHHDEWDYRAA